MKSMSEELGIEPSEKLIRYRFVILNSIQDPRSNGHLRAWIPDQVRNDGNFSEGSIRNEEPKGKPLAFNEKFEMRNEKLNAQRSTLGALQRSSQC